MSTEKRLKKDNWRCFGYGATLIYTAIIGVLTYQFEVDLLTKISGMKLNEVGDLLAGVFAPLAFLWLFVATMIQSEELKLQRQEIEENRKVMNKQAAAADAQAAIAIATARANYKFSMHDKRTSVYAELDELILVLNNEGRFVKDEDLARFNRAMRNAHYLFGKDVNDWLMHVSQLSREARKRRSRFVRWEMKHGSTGLTDAQEDEAENLLNQAISAEGMLLDEFDWEKLDTMFNPYMTLPAEIEVPEQRDYNAASQ